MSFLSMLIRKHINWNYFMAEKLYMEFIDYAKGLYSKALQLLEPGNCDDFSVISGSLILMVGLEKLTKSIIYKINPLMVLIEKPDFSDLIKLTQGDKFSNRNTISFEKALERAVELYPKLNLYQKDIKSIIEDRNLLMHNFGYIDIGKLEQKIQIKVADFTEAICREAMNYEPEEILGNETWFRLEKNRSAYKQAEVLELQSRIKHLRRLLSQGESLPCDPVNIPKDKVQKYIDCPVCEEGALVAFDIDWDIDVDHREGVVLSAYPISVPILLKCDCGFTLTDYEEIEVMLGDKYDEVCGTVISQMHEDEHLEEY